MPGSWGRRAWPWSACIGEGPVIASSERLKEDIAAVLGAIREEADARYACILDPRGIRFEVPEPLTDEGVALHRLLYASREDLFGIPRALAAGTEPPDVFADWEQDEFFLAFVNERVAVVVACAPFVNERVAVVVACAHAEPVRETALPHLTILADRLLRFDERYRIDRQGRGLFFGQPKLDMIVVGGHA
jgi:hypothetical protein